jgi:DNA repair protein RadA/Sms
VACFGELGLTGELRSTAHPDRRLSEAAKFGLRAVISPQTAATLRAALSAALGAQAPERAVA